MAKNDFQWYIVCLCLKSFAKSHVFKENYGKFQFNCTSFSVQGQPGLKIEIRDDSWTHRCHESNDGLRILKQASIINHIFRGKFFRLDLREILITFYPGLCFGNRAYP